MVQQLRCGDRRQRRRRRRRIRRDPDDCG